MTICKNFPIVDTSRINNWLLKIHEEGFIFKQAVTSGEVVTIFVEVNVLPMNKDYESREQLVERLTR